MLHLFLYSYQFWSESGASYYIIFWETKTCHIKSSLIDVTRQETFAKCCATDWPRIKYHLTVWNGSTKVSDCQLFRLNSNCVFVVDLSCLFWQNLKQFFSVCCVVCLFSSPNWCLKAIDAEIDAKKDTF